MVLTESDVYMKMEDRYHRISKTEIVEEDH